MNLDGINLTVERETLKVTLEKWGQRVVIRFVVLEHLMQWMYEVGTAKVHHPNGLPVPVMAQLAHANFGHLLRNDFF